MRGRICDLSVQKAEAGRAGDAQLSFTRDHKEEEGTAVTFCHEVGVAGVFTGDDLLYQLIVTQFSNSAHGLRTLGSRMGWEETKDFIFKGRKQTKPLGL